MSLTMKEKVVVSRALGLIEAAAALVDEKAAKKLYDALEILESVLKV